ncbi:MAG TPA: apolipoprotein N-acyltransferase, partial [Spirochaetota bacterium]
MIKIRTILEELISLISRHYYLASSILIFLSFPSYEIFLFRGFPFFAWVSLVPLLIFVKGKPFKTVYLTSFMTSLFGAFLSFGWMRTFGRGTPGGEFSIVLFLVPCIAFLWSGRILVAELLSQRNERFRVFIYPAIWIIGDIIQSLGFLAFPWTYWGYSQFPITPIIQIASAVGIHGVTFLLIMGNTLCADAVTRFRSNEKDDHSRIIRKYAAHISFIIVIGIISLWGVYRISAVKNTAGKPLKIAMIQSCISPWEDWLGNRFHYLNELTTITLQSLKQKPDFIIWSESATLEPIGYHYRKRDMDSFEASVCSFARNAGVPLLTGEVGVKEVIIRRLAYPQNSAILIDRNGVPEKEYAKIHLAPFGEWFPYDRLFPSIRDFVSEMGGSSFLPGKDPVVFNTCGSSFGVLICYEGMFYRLSRVYARKGVDFLVNITNDGWSDTYAGHYQHF